MNITAFLNYLNKTRGWAIDADYYGHTGRPHSAE